AREPWDRSNLERFRRALELLGEPDPEALIAERLSGQSPFMTTDLFLEANDFPVAPNEAPQATDSVAAPEPQAPAQPVPEPPRVSSVHVAESVHASQPELAEPRPAEKRVARPAPKPVQA